MAIRRAEMRGVVEMHHFAPVSKQRPVVQGDIVRATLSRHCGSHRAAGRERSRRWGVRRVAQRSRWIRAFRGVAECSDERIRPGLAVWPACPWRSGGATCSRLSRRTQTVGVNVAICEPGCAA